MIYQNIGYKLLPKEEKIWKSEIWSFLNYRKWSSILNHCDTAVHVYFDHEGMTLKMELLLGSSDGDLAVKHNWAKGFLKSHLKFYFPNIFKPFSSVALHTFKDNEKKRKIVVHKKS